MELYHLLNRGVDKRDIFLDEKDYVRFIHDLYEFNCSEGVDNTRHRLNTDLRSPYLISTREQNKIVDIHGWVLMRNHYHLLLSERVEGGLTLFLRKLNIGYAKYFNERYERSGTLFQGRTKKILIQRQSHFLYILHYIHLNPLDYLEGYKEWRVRSKGTIRARKTALEYLDSYRWSSYLDYCGTKNFPSILTTHVFKNEDVFSDYQKAIYTYLKDAEDDSLSSETLE